MGEADVQRRVLDSADPQRGNTAEGPPAHIRARRLRWTDLPSLSRVASRHYLNQPGSSIPESDPLRMGMRNLLPFTRRQREIFVALSSNDHRLVGFCQFRVVGPDQRWVMESLGTGGDGIGEELIIEEIARHAVVTAGQNGVKRIYARVEEGRSIGMPLRRIGFAPYMREHILVAPAVPEVRRAPGVRRQEQADVWSIHQLYMASTPRQVQYAEALTSHSWDVGALRRSNGYGCRGWLVADDYLALAYARAITRRDAHVLEFMVVPEQRPVFRDLLATALWELATMPARPVYVIVREYQSECASVLLDLGFEMLLQQDAYVKYTTASARSSMMAASFAVESAEPAAKRVPTFLHGTPEMFLEVGGGGRQGLAGAEPGASSGREPDRHPRGRGSSGQQWSVD